MRSFELKETFEVNPEIVYSAWLDSEQHADMTGGEAECSDQVGGEFSAWDGYITGTNRALTPNKEIVQAWRTSEFMDEDEDSELLLQFAEIEGGCELTLIHRNIPEGNSDYENGWKEHYFEPMKAYFAGK